MRIAWVHLHLPKYNKWLADREDPEFISVKIPGEQVQYVNSIVLSDAEFKVSTSGRNRALRDNQRNVHAWIVGEWNQTGSVLLDFSKLRRTVYDPWKGSTFVDLETLEPVYSSPFVAMIGKNVYYLVA